MGPKPRNKARGKRGSAPSKAAAKPTAAAPPQDMMFHTHSTSSSRTPKPSPLMRPPLNGRPRQTEMFLDMHPEFEIPNNKPSGVVGEEDETETRRIKTIKVIHNSVTSKLPKEIGEYNCKSDNNAEWLEKLLSFRNRLLNDFKYTPGAADTMFSQNIDKITKTEEEKKDFEEAIESTLNMLTLEIPWARVFARVEAKYAKPLTPEQELAELAIPDFSDFLYVNYFNNKITELWDHDGLKYPIAGLINKFTHDFDKQRLEQAYRQISGRGPLDEDPEIMHLNRFCFKVIQEYALRQAAERDEPRLTGGATPRVAKEDRLLFDRAIQASPKFSYIRQCLIMDPDFDTSVFEGDSSVTRLEKWSLKGGLLYLGDRPCVGKDLLLKTRLFAEHHDRHVEFPHYTVDAAWKKLAAIYFWPMIKKDVEKMCDQCERCHPKLVPASKWPRTPEFPFERVTVNLVKGFKPSVGYRDGSDSVMVVMDVVSHYGLFLAVDSRKGQETFRAHFDQYVIERHAVPATIVPRGREMNTLALDLAKTMQIKPLGLEEGDKYHIMHAKVEQLINRNVRKDYDGWIFDLAMVMNNYNNTVVPETGKAPNETIMGSSGQPVDLDQYKSEFKHHTFIKNPFNKV